MDDEPGASVSFTCQTTPLAIAIDDLLSVWVTI